MKAPKKDKKDVDEDDMAFKQKKAAGTYSPGDSIDLLTFWQKKRHGRKWQQKLVEKGH